MSKKEENRLNEYKRKILICTTLSKRFTETFCVIKYPDNSPGLIFSVVNWRLISKVLWVGRQTFCTLFGQVNCEIIKIGSHRDCLQAFTKHQIQYSNRREECLAEKNKPALIQRKISHFLNQ